MPNAVSTAIVQIFGILLDTGFWHEKSQQIFLTPLADQETHERENVTKLTRDDV